MPEFLKLIDPVKALELILENTPLPVHLSNETVQTEASLDRVIASDYFALEPSPPFSRSTVDGYAVQAKDTNGASDSIPMYFRVTGEVLMGRKAELELRKGEAILIHTGGMLPSNADAVVMLENTQLSRPGEIEVHRAVSHLENTILAGEDVQQGELIIGKGSRIRAAEMGGLLSQGINSVEVFSIPRIGIISSGDEVVMPDKKITDGQIRDINSYTLSSIVKKFGGEPTRYGISSDKFEDLQKIVKKAFKECDAVLVTAGSSVSARDITKDVIASLGKPGILVHGVNVKPGKPTILAICNGKPVIGLPGNPVSAYVIATIFFIPVLEKISGLTRKRILPQVKAKMTINYPSIAGRTDYVPVKLTSGKEIQEAEPIFFKSNLIFTLVKATGLAIIPADSNGVSTGEIVDVLLI